MYFRFNNSSKKINNKIIIKFFFLSPGDTSIPKWIEDYAQNTPKKPAPPPTGPVTSSPACDAMTSPEKIFNRPSNSKANKYAHWKNKKAKQHTTTGPGLDSSNLENNNNNRVNFDRTSNLEANSRVNFDRTSNLEDNSRVNFDRTSKFEVNSTVDFDRTSNLESNARVNFDRENVNDCKVYNGSNSPNHNRTPSSDNNHGKKLRRRNTPDQDMNWRERKKPLEEIIERENQILTATKCV